MNIKTEKLETAIWNMALSLFVVRGDRIDPSGSAILIARDYALTARHVIEGHCQTLNDNLRFPRAGENTANYLLYAQQQFPEYRANICRPIQRCWISTLTDLAVIKLKEPSPNESEMLKGKPAPILRLTPPEIGTPVCGFGFCEPNFGVQRIDRSASRVDWQIRGRTAKGKVTDRYPKMRERGFLNFPSFQTDSDFLHSMSGGPIFDDMGRVCGVISAGSAFSGPGSFSYAASLWPLMAIPVDQVVVGNHEAKILMHELARRQIVAADDWHRVSVDANMDSTIVNSVSLHDELGTVLATISNS